MSDAKYSPRILYVTESWVLSASIGPQVRCLSQLRALQEIGNVEVVTLVDEEHRRSALEIPGAPKIAYTLATEPRPNAGLLAKLRFTFDPKTNFPYGCGAKEEGILRLLNHSREFDLIWFFKQRSADMFPDSVWSRSIIDIDDVQSTYEQAALKKNGLANRLAALRGLFSWRRREKLLGERFSVLTVCSEEDKLYLQTIGVRAPIHVIPNGYEKPSVEPLRDPARPPRIGFIGAFDYPPNREGVSWFVSQCWGSVKREIPSARLRLIGRDSEKFADLRGEDVDCLGSVPEPAEEMKTWSCMIVPIRLGAGTRVKIAHAFSQKCPIVSTPLGAHGYGAVDGREMYLADSASAFASACLKTILDPEGAGQMARRAWEIFLERWSLDAIRPRIWAAAEECLRINHRAAPQRNFPTSLVGNPQSIPE
jgi:glycosyltransferase involved in cell wall biosynthesis